jgi:hypothetical protein
MWVLWRDFGLFNWKLQEFQISNLEVGKLGPFVFVKNNGPCHIITNPLLVYQVIDKDDIRGIWWMLSSYKYLMEGVDLKIEKMLHCQLFLYWTL